jgi:GNAT superfamily N-acetyltransferase
MDLLERQVVTLRETVLPSDRDIVRAIVERTGFFRSDEVDVAVELVDERLSRGVASGYQFLFAECNETIAGYACYGPIACTVASYDLYWIAVEPRFQRHGIGQQLVSAVRSKVADARGERIYVDTSGRPQYAATRSFYERCGFHCDARLVDFYAPGDDRIIYAQRLDGN